MEGEVGLLLFSYLVAKFGPTRIQKERAVLTLTQSKNVGRPQQVDFAIGRKQQSTGSFQANTVIELAVRRTRHKSGADPGVNGDEIRKLVRAEARHRILLLVDLTADDVGRTIVQKYRDRGYSRGRPRGKPTDSIVVVYVGEHGTARVKLKRRNLKGKNKPRKGK